MKRSKNIKKEEYTCFHCENKFTPAFIPTHLDRPYCSRSCSVSSTNKMSPKRVAALSKCTECDSTFSGRGKRCPDHRNTDPQSKTLGHHRNLPSHKHPSWAHSTIRQMARYQYSKELKCCQICGYDKHVELAHIKPLHQWDDSATVKEVNDRSNILFLCPNHHWEFDYGDLTLEEIKASHSRLELLTGN